MPAAVRLKPGSLKDPEIAQLFSNKDPDFRYCDLREVGSGSFGNVYYAHDRENKETVAIKKMAFVGKDAMEKWMDIVKEVRFLRSVQHPNIVRFRSCHLKEQTCWLIMEYCIGSASDIINVFKEQLVEDAIAEICDQTLSALAYIHDRNYIHRDVKAGNILITDAGVVKLGDLGSASLQSPANSFVGSPYWIAPEVILAMDDGEYGIKSDIWSLGITCIELANRKPPLYDLNTMSALYHIAQNDPPVLSRVHPQFAGVVRSNEIISFVQLCLQKDPSSRPMAADCKNHEFLLRKRRSAVMSNVVKQTKKRVTQLDNYAYSKMKKIFYLEGAPITGGFEGDSSTDDEECFISQPVEDAHSKGTLMTAKNGEGDHLQNESNDKDSSKQDKTTTTLTNTNTLESSSSGSVPTTNGTERKGISSEATTADMLSVHGRENSKDSENPKNRTVISISENEEETETSTPSTTTDPSLSSNRILQQREINEEINTLKRSKFATLRPTKLITREVEEARRENNAKEQMSGYQRLRQHHQRELQQLEERCKFEVDAMRQKHEKEYEQLLISAQREIHKLRTANQTQLEKKLRENEDLIKKTRKQRVAANEHEWKSFVVCQKREYKFNKEQAKRQLKERGLRKTAYEDAVKHAKSELLAKWNAVEAEFVAQQKELLADEIAAMKRKCQTEFQCLEQRLLANEHAVRTRQLEAVETMLMQHHNAARDQALYHIEECAQMKKRHLQVQHDSELSNQMDYTKRQEDDMKRLHALKQKNLPRELKLKEAQIKKQFRHTVKTQARQYKVLQAQLMQGVAKDEQKEISNRLKEEQTRKIATLAALYDNNIKTMMSEQTIQLDSSKEEELRKLDQKLKSEMNKLREYQLHQKHNLDMSCAREYENCKSMWTSKKSQLQRKIDEDHVRFEKERANQFRQLELEQENERQKLQTASVSERDRAASMASEKRSEHSTTIGSVPSTPNLQSNRNSRSASTSNRSSPSHQSTNL
ncbi:hypothetical protein M3Y94_00295700 [Aphelenchoides besseyi]|nr:hypothetical protein M3Y94_00295700 [Aphelenchoides besseyi]